MRSKKSIGVLLGLSFGLVSAMSFAWACTSQPTIVGLTPSVAPRSASFAERPMVTVRGQGISSSEPVTIRWNALDGPVLATAQIQQDGSFSGQIAIPDADPGIYFVLVTDPSNGSVGRAPFEVTNAPHRATDLNAISEPTAKIEEGDLWRGFSGSGPGPTWAEGLGERPLRGTGMYAGIAMAGVGLMAIATLATLVVKRKTKAARNSSGNLG